MRINNFSNISQRFGRAGHFKSVDQAAQNLQKNNVTIKRPSQNPCNPCQTPSYNNIALNASNRSNIMQQALNIGSFKTFTQTAISEQVNNITIA